MFSGVDALRSCLHEEIGFTETCAGCWATDIYCSKAHCIFIYLQSRMTNQLGNFAVGENKITAASCEESNCEAGNPGTFVGEHLLCLCLFWVFYFCASLLHTDQNNTTKPLHLNISECSGANRRWVVLVFWLLRILFSALRLLLATPPRTSAHFIPDTVFSSLLLLRHITNTSLLLLLSILLSIFRRMDIRDVIKRPADELCKIVGILQGANGPDWGKFFDPTCPRDVSPP